MNVCSKIICQTRQRGCDLTWTWKVSSGHGPPVVDRMWASRSCRPALKFCALALWANNTVYLIKNVVIIKRAGAAILQNNGF